MNQELRLRRKWTFRAHDRQVVFVKKPYESDIHVLTKAFIWALYLPDYPGLSVEIHIGNRYKPDIVQLDQENRPLFWGEAGRVGQRKIRDLIKRFHSTHIVFAKWNMDLSPLRKVVEGEIKRAGRSAPVDLISFPEGIDERCIDADGTIRVSFSDVSWFRCSGAP